MGAILGIDLAVAVPRRRRTSPSPHLIVAAQVHIFLPGAPQDFLEIGQVLVLGRVLLDRFFLLYYSSSCTNIRRASRKTFRRYIRLGGVY
jgi:hypothetical protein